jgi:hypothetical protein
MKRYSIMGVQYGSERETELAQVDAEPEAIVAGLEEKFVLVNIGGSSRRSSIPKYSQLRIVDHERPGAKV